MSSLNLVELKTKDFSEARAELAKRVRALNDEVEKAKRKHLVGIRHAVDKAAEAHAALYGAIEENANLFEKPRTQTFHGVKVGYRKAVGDLSWEDDESVVKQIRKHFADQFDVLVKTRETPMKAALAQLPAAELKKLGVEIGNDGDEVFIKPTDTEIDKLVTALLKDAVEEEVES